MLIPIPAQTWLGCPYHRVGEGCFLDYSVLRPGDLVFSTPRFSWSSLSIRLYSPGPYSHTAVVVAPWTLLEAVKPVVRRRLPVDAISIKLKSSTFHVLEPLDSVRNIGVFRPPALASQTSEAVEQALCDIAALFEHHDYGWQRLALSLRVGDRVHATIEDATRKKEGNLRSSGRLPGPFCSELVACFLAATDPQHSSQPPTSPTPNSLARKGFPWCDSAIVRLAAGLRQDENSTRQLRRAIQDLRSRFDKTAPVVRALKISEFDANQALLRLDAFLASINGVPPNPSLQRTTPGRSPG